MLRCDENRTARGLVTGEHSAALAESDASHQTSPRTIFESVPWRSLVFLPVLLISACGAARKPTVSDAQKFMDTVESRLLTLGVEAQRADWVRSTYITGDTEILSAQADQKAIEAQVAFVKEAQQFSGLTLPPALARKFYLLKTSLTFATPSDPAKSAELTRIVSNMESSYGKGKYCKPDGKCLTVEDLGRLMANSRNRAELLDAWRGWHTISPPLRQPFARYVQLANEGARQLGFADAGALWRARYDMSPRRVSRGARPPLESGSSALHGAAHVRAKTPSRAIWSECGSRAWTDPRRPSRQYVGAGLE